MNWEIESPDSLAAFLMDLGDVYAPSGKDILKYSKLDRNGTVDLSRLSDFSAKEILLPITQYYMKFNLENTENTDFLPLTKTYFTVLGLRPCDIKGLQVFESLFYESSSFRDLREKMTVIGYLCDKPSENCFCESTGVEPLSVKGMDLVMYPVDGKYILSAKTEKGRKLLEKSSFKTVENPPEPMYKGKQSMSINVKSIAENAERIDNEHMHKIAFGCINCRICSYVCPTCHCFTVTDEVFKNEGGRAIVWDSCQSKYFTQEASGANPRKEKSLRVKNRILHKFKYYTTKNGDVMCSGCGRCISNCPSGLNIFKEIDETKMNCE